MKNPNLHIKLMIVVASICIGVLYNLFNPKGISFIRTQKEIKWENDSSQTTISRINETTPISDSVSSNEEKNDQNKNLDLKSFSEPKAIKIDFAYKLFKQGIKFIDARPIEEFEENHIRGAINIPFYGSEKYDSILYKIPKSDIVVTYCNGDDCDLSILLGNELFNKGYKKVYVFFGGWNEWLKQGYPVEK